LFLTTFQFTATGQAVGCSGGAGANKIDEKENLSQNLVAQAEYHLQVAQELCQSGEEGGDTAFR